MVTVLRKIVDALDMRIQTYRSLQTIYDENFADDIFDVACYELECKALRDLIAEYATQESEVDKQGILTRIESDVCDCGDLG